MMFQEVPCSASLSISQTRDVLPGCHPSDVDVLCYTRIPGRLRAWRQRTTWPSVEEYNAPAIVSLISKVLASVSSGINRYVGLRRQLDDSTNSNADQATSETTYVSPQSAVASSLSESAPTPSPSLTGVGSSSEQPDSTSAPSNAPSESNVETTTSISSTSIAPEQTVSTSETVITAGPSQSSITISESSTLTFPSSAFPESQSTIPPTSTSPPSLTPSETDIPDSTATVSSSTSRQGPSSITTTSTSPSSASSPLAWSASSSSSRMEAGGTSSFSFPTLGSTVSLPVSSPPSSMSEFTTTSFPPFTSVSSEDTSSTISSFTSESLTSSSSFSSSSLPTSSRVTSSSSTPTSDAVFSTSSDTTSSQDTSPANRPTRTITITRVFTTTFSDGRTTTISTVVETGVLRTDTPQQLGGLGRNTGAIAGIAVAVTLAVIFVIFLLFYGCRRYRARQNFDRGSIDILARAREVWRPPIDGDDDDVSYLRGHNSLNRRQTLGSQEHSGEGGYIGQGSSGDHLSGEGGGAGSAESTNIGMASAMHPTFGGQPYMPNMTQTMGDPFARLAPVVLPAHSANDGHAAEGANQYWWGINDPQAARDIGGRRSETSENSVPQMASRSAVSLTVVGGSGSSGGHGSGSSHGKSGVIKAKRNSMNGPRPMPKSEGRRHSSTPPSAFVGSLRESAYDCERQEQSDRNSVKGFLNRLRTTSHRVSTQSIATLRGTPAPQPRATTDDTSFLPPPGVYSPSLLNPPQALLRFPRGVTGNGYTSLSPPLPQMSSAGYDLHPPSFPWPTMTLPSAPSPVPTDASSMVEGLLHPRLGALDTAQQASTASLRDHEDYTRPINGLVNNHLRSTTTFDTLNSEEGGPMIAS